MRLRSFACALSAALAGLGPAAADPGSTLSALWPSPLTFVDRGDGLRLARADAPYADVVIAAPWPDRDAVLIAKTPRTLPVEAIVYAELCASAHTLAYLVPAEAAASAAEPAAVETYEAGLVAHVSRCFGAAGALRRVLALTNPGPADAAALADPNASPAPGGPVLLVFAPTVVETRTAQGEARETRRLRLVLDNR